MSALADWPALVLTAGLASRLRPLSAVRAKAALPIAGDTLIGRVLRQLCEAGVRRVVLNLHHRAESVTRIVGDGSRWGLQVRYSWEWPLLGSAGGPARALPLIEADRFLIVNGDTLTDVDLRELTRLHVTTGAEVTMAVVAGDPLRYGRVVVNEDFTVRGFVPAGEPATGRTAHFVGVQAVNASAFSGVPWNEPLETVGALYPRLIARRPGSVHAVLSQTEFFDIGTPLDYLETATRIAAREGRPLDRGRDCTIEPDTRLDGTLLWDQVTIRAGAALTECIVADGVVVPAGARHARCSLVMTDAGPVATPF